jgi:hypothetical protein
MFATSSKPVVLDRYSHRRASRRPPRWLVLLLVGVAAGVAGVLTVQQRYLPPRLSAAESSQLRGELELAQSERKRLTFSLEDATKRLNAALADKKTLTDELATARARVEDLKADLSATVAVLPPDPRGGSVAVRAGRFGTARNGQLSYELVLTRDKSGPMQGVIALTVEGDGARGGDGTLQLKPIALSMASHEVARGTVPLPDGYRARQVTIRILTQAGGAMLGMRVLPVKP